MCNNVMIPLSKDWVKFWQNLVNMVNMMKHEDEMIKWEKRDNVMWLEWEFIQQISRILKDGSQHKYFAVEFVADLLVTIQRRKVEEECAHQIY